MNGTARKMTPGTRVATVTGIQTCCPRRSMVSISSRWTSRRMARASSADQPAEVARLAVERQDPDQPVEALDVGHRRPLPQGLGLRQALADAPTTRCRSRRTPLPRGQPVERGTQRVAGRQQHAELLGDDRQLEEDAALPRLRLRRPGAARPPGSRSAARSRSGAAPPVRTVRGHGEDAGPSRSPTAAHPSCRTRKAVTSSGESMRSSRTARGSVTPTAGHPLAPRLGPAGR